MKIVAAKCTNCGGVLEVDSDKEAAVCKYCNTPFIVEKAIENYNITNNYTTVNNTVNNISGREVHIHQDGESPEQLLENIKALLKRGESRGQGQPVHNAYEKLKEKYPADYRVDEADVYWYCNYEKFEFWHPQTFDWNRVKARDIGDQFDKKFFTAFDNLRDGNRAVYETYYQQLLQNVNKKINAETNKNFRGGMLRVKLATMRSIWGYGKESIQYGLRDHLGYEYRNGDWSLDTCHELSTWDGQNYGVRDIMKAFEAGSKEDADDEFIVYIISEMDGAIAWSRNWKPSQNWLRMQNIMQWTTDYRTVLKPREDTMISVRNAFLKCLSADGRKKYEEEQNRKRAEKRKGEIIGFWNRYIDYLKRKKLKDAYELLLADSSVNGTKTEFVKFKKGFFGVKYLGDIIAIDVNALIDSSLKSEGLKR